MNALEKLGYVKQPNGEDVVLYTKPSTLDELKIDVIAICKSDNSFKKYRRLPMYNEHYPMWVQKKELKAILELMEE